MLSLGWTNDVLKFWFDEAGSDRWFGKDATFDDLCVGAFAWYSKRSRHVTTTSSWSIPEPR